MRKELLAICILLSGVARAEPPTKTVELLQKAGKLCFLRVYDAAHMAANPTQKVQRIYLAVASNMSAAYWLEADAQKSEMSPKRFAESMGAGEPSSATPQIAGFLTLRGGAKPESFSGFCQAESEAHKGALSCGMECDRHIGEITLKSGSQAMFEGLPRDIFLEPGDEETNGPSKLTLGKGDDHFRLEVRPVEECLAEAAKANPSWARIGQPLRLRLKPEAPFCFGRDYTAAHLAAHPNQRTLSIRLSRSAKAVNKARAAGSLANWPEDVALDLAVTSRKGSFAQRYVCAPEENQWVCVNHLCNDKDGDCNGAMRKTSALPACAQHGADATIYVRRGAGETLMLGNPTGALPLEGDCGDGERTASDDASFRLEPLPLSACENL